MGRNRERRNPGGAIRSTGILPALLAAALAPAAACQAAGTVRGEPDRPAGFSQPYVFCDSDGRGGNEPFLYDGLAAPERIALMGSGAPGMCSEPTLYGTLGDEVFFTARDDRHGSRLWSLDRQSRRCAPVPGIVDEDVADAGFGEMIPAGGRLYLTVGNPPRAAGLWSIAKGEPAATRRPFDGAFPRSLVECDGAVFFLASTPTGGSTASLWTDAPGTDKPRKAAAVRSFGIGGLSKASSDGVLFLSADAGDGTGMEPWAYDCRSGAVRKVADLNPQGGSDPMDLTPLDGDLFFFASDGGQTRMWRARSDAQGASFLTEPLRIDLYPQAGTLRAIDGTLFFTATVSDVDRMCWYDPDSIPATGCLASVGWPLGTVRHERSLFFFAVQDVVAGGDCCTGRILWRYDGQEGPRKVFSRAGRNGDAP